MTQRMRLYEEDNLCGMSYNPSAVYLDKPVYAVWGKGGEFWERKKGIPGWQGDPLGKSFSGKRDVVRLD